jgi:hypothetical protein
MNWAENVGSVTVLCNALRTLLLVMPCKIRTSRN